VGEKRCYFCKADAIQKLLGAEGQQFLLIEANGKKIEVNGKKSKLPEGCHPIKGADRDQTPQEGAAIKKCTVDAMVALLPGEEGDVQKALENSAAKGPPNIRSLVETAKENLKNERRRIARADDMKKKLEEWLGRSRTRLRS